MPEIDEETRQRHEDYVMGKDVLHAEGEVMDALRDESLHFKHQVALHATRMLLKLHEQYVNAGDERKERDAINKAASVYSLAKAIGVEYLPSIMTNTTELLREYLAKLEKNDA